MPQKTDLHNYTIPVSIDESPEDNYEWDQILINFFNDELEEDIPFHSSVADRPAASDYPGLLHINTDNSPPTIERSDGSNYVTIGSMDSDTLDGYDSSEFGVLAENESVSGSWSFSSEQTFNGGINGSLTGNTALSNIPGTNLSIDANGNLDATDTRTDISDSGTAVLSNTTGVNFGEGLGVTDDGDGSVTVDYEGVNTLYMSDYAPTGGLCDTEFDSAITDATEGDRIIFDHNSYELNTSHTISKSLIIDATADTTVSCTNTTNNNPHIHFQGGGIVNNTTSSAAISQGDRIVPVNDTTVFTAGDNVLIMEAQHSAQVDTKIHFDQVETVDGTNGEIDLFGGVYKEFASGSYVYHVDLLKQPEIRNIQTDGGGLRHLQFQWCENPKYDNVHVSEYLEVSVYALECWKPVYQDVEVTDPTGTASGEGEPIAIYRSTDGYVESPRVYDCRRGIDFAWGSHTHAIVDPVIRGVSLNGISVHQDNQAGSLMITGGEIVCDPNGQSGAGITSSTTAKTYIDGIRIVARENGIICNGQTLISNVTITPTEGNTSAPIAGFNIKYGDTTIRDSYIDDPDGLFDFPVWVDGGGSSNTKHITIDCEITHSGSDHVYLDARNGGIEHVRIKGFLRGLNGSASEAIFIRADGTSTIDNVDVSVHATGLPNQGVRILSGGTEQVTNVRFQSCYFGTGAAAIYTDGTGSFGPIHVSDSSCDTGTTSLSFNETVSKLFITNNQLSGSIDSTGATNSTVTGNL